MTLCLVSLKLCSFRWPSGWWCSSPRSSSRRRGARLATLRSCVRATHEFGWRNVCRRRIRRRRRPILLFILNSTRWQRRTGGSRMALWWGVWNKTLHMCGYMPVNGKFARLQEAGAPKIAPMTLTAATGGLASQRSAWEFVRSSAALLAGLTMRGRADDTHRRVSCIWMEFEVAPLSDPTDGVLEAGSDSDIA